MSILTMGIDVGSTASKCVILKDGSEIVSKSLVAVGTGTSGPSRAIAQVLENAGMTREQMDFVLATGYGRNSLDGLADMQMSELSCHAKGAAFLFPNVRTVVDIGGQDVKVIEIENGMMKNFVMNDKCAAGTGRFFEAMARSFELSLPEFSKLSLTAKNVIPITAQCTVFAESEVITLVGEGKPTDEIAAGIEMAVAKRCFVMAKKAGATDSITLTGGCAKNAGLKQAIEHVLKFKVVDLKTDPQLMGALGAAEYARQKGLAKK
mgnify:CR=1 FL=1